MESLNMLVRPILSEKASASKAVVVLQVRGDANKYQIKSAVETAYGVVVDSVRTLLVAGKVKRRGQTVVRRPRWKKAIITLADGHSINFLAAE